MNFLIKIQRHEAQGIDTGGNVDHDERNENGQVAQRGSARLLPDRTRWRHWVTTCLMQPAPIDAAVMP
jgi:hypothetical protein